MGEQLDVERGAECGAMFTQHMQEATERRRSHWPYWWPTAVSAGTVNHLAMQS